MNVKNLLVAILLINLPGCATARVPNELPAWFHRPNTAESYNLAIFPNGTFRWSHDGCDYGSGGYGLWRLAGNAIIFYGKNSTGFEWPTGIVRTSVMEVLVEPIESGILTTIQNGKNKNPLIWEKGLICAQCEGSFLGPRKPAVACDQYHEDFMKQWLSKEIKTNQ